jgi:hypothetical protein
VGDTDAGPRCTSPSTTSSATSPRRAPTPRARSSAAGTVSNVDRARGISCLAERRTIETIERGKPETPFLKVGDTVAIEMLDATGARSSGASSRRWCAVSVTRRLEGLGVDTKPWLSHFIGTGLAALEAAARDGAGRFLVGDEPSLADCCLVPQLYSARRFGVALDGLPTLLRVEAACAALPAFERAHPDVQPDAPARAPA